jgi:hypothetical protein
MKKIPALLLLSSIVLFPGCSKEPHTLDFFEDAKNVDTFAQVLKDCRNKNTWDTDQECKNAKTVYQKLSDIFMNDVRKLFTEDQRLKIIAAFDGLSIEEYKKRKEQRVKEIEEEVLKALTQK